jgi:hypothetical protein
VSALTTDSIGFSFGLVHNCEGIEITTNGIDREDSSAARGRNPTGTRRASGSWPSPSIVIGILSCPY